ncbi:hypothetical protein [Collinsella aerofaciens]|uniref:hypothetical protein n=1 Tax=Collinsella aerofaciens TaxID=74426 RepID=UPI00186AA8BB|nr:hypothetical protein [Collinsella aerofaciens]
MLQIETNERGPTRPKTKTADTTKDAEASTGKVVSATRKEVHGRSAHAIGNGKVHGSVMVTAADGVN